jgi:hypothetical protein
MDKLLVIGILFVIGFSGLLAYSACVAADLADEIDRIAPHDEHGSLIHELPVNQKDLLLRK